MSDVSVTLLQKELEYHLAFYRRRHEIEVEYVDHLKKLAAKEHAEDRSGLPPSWRKAASLVRATTFEDAQAHAVFATALDEVVKKLDKLKDDKDRMRRRVNEDLRRTRDAHADYVSVLSSLRKSYERKVEDVQAHEREESERDQQHEREFPPEHWTGSESTVGKSETGRERKGSVGAGRAPTPGTATPHEGESPPTGSFGSPPNGTPVFVSGAGTTSTAAPSAYREPPTAGKPNVFEAIAKRDWNSDKSKFNSIARAVGNLAKGGDASTGGQGLGHHKSNSVKGSRSRATSSRLKREAEQADRDYRAGVWRCETLRLQRSRVHTSARTFLIDFAGELSWILRDVMASQSTGMHSVGGAMYHIGDALKQGSDEVHPQADAEEFSHNLRSAPPELPIFYHNYFVGECRDLLFGVSLSDYHSTHPDRLVPQIVQQCISFVDAHGLRTEGIYRISGKQTTVQQLVHKVESNERDFRFDEKEESATVAGLLKLYLRQLPSPLFPYPTADRLNFSNDIMKDYETTMSGLTRRLRRLPPVNQATLKALVEHLARVAQHEQANKMTASNLGLIFSAVVFGEEEATIESARLSTKDLVMEVIISQHSVLFEELPLDASKARSRGASPIGRVRSRGASGSSAGAPEHHHHRSLLAPELEPTASYAAHASHAPHEPSSIRPDSSNLASDQRTLHIKPNPNVAAQDPSRESVFNDYREAATQLLPAQQSRGPSPLPPQESFPQQVAAQHPPVSENDMLPPAPHFIRSRASSDHDLSTPSPPLSAAGGRRVPEGSSTTI